MKLFVLLAVLLLLPAALFAQTVPDAVLTWQDNSLNETGFEIERQLNGGAFAKIGQTTSANIVTVIDTTRVAGTGPNTYCYRVRAVNSAGASGYTNVACATAIPAIVTIPAAASNLVVTP